MFEQLTLETIDNHNDNYDQATGNGEQLTLNL